MTAQSTLRPARRKDSKPAKPYPDFPLFPHATRRWAKKIRGKLHYFGPWDDPDAALQNYLDRRDDLHAGRTPRTTNGDGLTVRDLANRYLTHKKHLVDSGEITPRTWADYHSSCENMIKTLGRDRLVVDLGSDDFRKLRNRLAKTRGPVALGNEITRVRGVFKFAFDEELIDRPIRYGQGFSRPKKKTLRKAPAAKGPRMFEAAEIRQMLDAAPVHLKAMILLAINCGFGNSDVGTLPQTAIDLERGWHNYGRPKTGIERRCPFWPETVVALKDAMAQRPKAKDKKTDGLVFVTKYGQSWAKQTVDNPISNEMRKLLDALDLHRPGLGFYALRHTFETIGGDSRDQVAVDYIMGHAASDRDMSAVYRERISDDRLQAVVDHVRVWLLRETGGK